ncbi:MAG: sigma-70 family RNA polymerase sigma factor [Clostridia bacterium]|nr:sigma-70 family RNA polymerase sigma factor [Clostridia bacterium]
MEKTQIAQLVDKVREGDNAAFEKLYNETNKGAYFVALKITGNEDDALDILQDSYVKALDKLGQLKDSATFVSWFNQIVANTAKNYICKLKPVLFNTEEEEQASQDWQTEEDSDFIPEESMDNAESRKAIMDIIDSLPEDRRLCVLMHYYDDMGTAQIAKALEISENTVKSHLHLARKSIKKTIEELRRKGATILSAAAIPFFIWMLRRSASACVMSQAKSAALLGLIKGASALLGGAAAAVAGGAAIAAGTAVKAGIAAKVIAWITVPKIIATVVGAVVIFGGVTAGVKIAKDRNPETTTTEPTGTYYDSSSDDTTLVTYVTGIVYDGYTLPEYSIIDDYSQNPTNDGEDIPVVATTGDSDKVTFGTAPQGTTAVNNKPAAATTANGNTTTKKAQHTDTTTEKNTAASTTKRNTTTAVQTTDEPIKTVPATTVPATIKPVPTTKPVTTTEKQTTTTRPTTTSQSTTTAPVTTTEPTTAASEFEYTVSGSSATVTGYKGSGGSISVPTKLGGATVTAIADYAFENNTSITSVSVPSTVTSIGKGAFANCTSLTSVTLPSGLRSLGNTAFKNCTRLSSVNIPSSLSAIPAGAFQGCAALTAVTIPGTVTSIGTNAFQGCPNLTISCPEGSAAQEYAQANGINCKSL